MSSMAITKIDGSLLVDGLVTIRIQTNGDDVYLHIGKDGRVDIAQNDEMDTLVCDLAKDDPWTVVTAA